MAFYSTDYSYTKLSADHDLFKSFERKVNKYFKNVHECNCDVFYNIGDFFGIYSLIDNTKTGIFQIRGDDSNLYNLKYSLNDGSVYSIQIIKIISHNVPNKYIVRLLLAACCDVNEVTKKVRELFEESIKSVSYECKNVTLCSYAHVNIEHFENRIDFLRRNVIFEFDMVT